MHGDYVYPSIFLSYLLFFLFLAGGIFFFVRSLRDGYWGKHSEDIKYIVLNDDERSEESAVKVHQGDAHARP
jgi:hypothetical protein